MSRPRAKLSKNFPGCPVESTLNFLDGKWKGVILFHILSGTHRFGELKRKLKSITQRMLTKQLRELEEAGLVTRTVHPVVPPHVDYALTTVGLRLEPVIVRSKPGAASTCLGRRPEDDHSAGETSGCMRRTEGFFRSSKTDAPKTTRPKSDSAAPTKPVAA